MSRTRTWLTLGFALAAAAACSDRPAAVSTDPTTPGGGGAPGGSVALASGATPRRPDRLALLLAKALGNPAFRAYLRAQLDSSRFPEHKLQFQSFLGASGGRALRELAQQNATTESEVEREAGAVMPLELYLPVPAHREAWAGDENVLVATALQDHDAPVAFDPSGQRTVLSPDAPPATPVIALVPVETDFRAPPARMQCLDCGGGGGGGGTTTTPGLYMTKSHFDSDYEGWLKGDPEYEIHILGQSGSTDSLADYQCAGAVAGGPYTFDQNALDWSGSVLLFSQTQINNYKAAHPNQGMRVFALEDDDTACAIKTDSDRANRLIAQVDSAYRQITGGTDSTTTYVRIWKQAKTAFNLFKAIASLIATNDELIGDAVEDDIVGSFYAGYNWIVKGENNITHGWLNLEMH